MKLKTKFIKTFSLVILIIFSLFIISCDSSSSEKAGEVTSPKVELQSHLKKVFSITTSPEITLETAKGGKGYDVYVSYTPLNLFKYKSEESDKKAFRKEINTKVKNLYSYKVKVNKIVISARDSNQKMVANPKGKLHIISSKEGETLREIATFEINKSQYDMYKEEFEDPEYKIVNHIKFHPFFLVELKLKTSGIRIKNLVVTEKLLNLTNETKLKYLEYLDVESLGNETSVLITDIIFEPSNIEKFSSSKNSKIDFEENFAKIIVSTYEADNSTDILNITAKMPDDDTRNSNVPTNRIVNYMTNREEYEGVVEDFDNYRSQIYEEMTYSPLYLLDLSAVSEIKSLEFNETKTTVYLEYGADYKEVTDTIEVLESDTVEVLRNMFHYFDVENVKLVFSAKIPPDEVSGSDNEHKILSEALVVDAQKRIFNSISLEKLENYQVLYNLNPNYDSELEALSFKEGFGLNPDLSFFKTVSFLSKKAIVQYDLCGLDFDSDNPENKIEKTLSKVEKQTKRALYENFPPYLESIELTFITVELNNMGSEDITKYGSITYEKDFSSNNFFSPRDNEAWLIVKDNSDIDGSISWCQAGVN